MDKPVHAWKATHLAAVAWVVAAVAIAVGCWTQFAQGRGVETNLLALLPATERNPVAEDVANRMADTVSGRAVFLVGAHTFEEAAPAAREFAAQLRQSGAFRGVLADLPPMDVRVLADLYAPHRFNLMTAADRAALATAPAALADRLAAKLYLPPRMGLATPITTDPLGLLDNWMAELPLGFSRLMPEDGLLIARESEVVWVLVAGELRGSAYDPQIQIPLVRAVADAEAALETAKPGVQVLRAGTVFYAHQARDQAQSEFDFIGGGALIGMLLMLYLVFRSPGPLLLGLCSVGFGIGAACLATRWWFGSIHLITLVFGASLIGEAIDYAIQYFAARLGAGPRWEPVAGLRRVAPGLTVALATSLLGYGALAMSPFLALAQIGLFAAVGLTAAWASVFLLLPAALPRPVPERKGVLMAWLAHALEAWRTRMDVKRRIALVVLMLLVALPGWLKLRSDDDIRLLINRPAALVQQEERIRAITGINGGAQFFLVEGRDAEQVLQREEALLDALRALPGASPVPAVSAFVPSRRVQEVNRTVYREHVLASGRRLEVALDDAGVREGVAVDLRAAFDQRNEKFISVDDWLASPISAPLRHLWQGRTAQGLASVVQVPVWMTPAQMGHMATSLTGITLVDKPASISGLFGQYRRQSAMWLAVALGLVFVVLVFRYRAGRAAVMLAPVLLAMAVTLGVFGHTGQALTLFHNMAFMLVLGVGVNYVIFLYEGGTSETAALAGVLLSAATTLLAYGLLGFSSMPALSGFGLTLLLGIGLAVLLAPMALPLRTVAAQERTA